MKHARVHIASGQIVETVEFDTPPELSAATGCTWYLVTTVEVGAGSQIAESAPAFNGTAVVVTKTRSEPPLAVLKERKLSELAAHRWNVETGGMVFNGAPVDTNDRAKGLIQGAYIKSKENPAYTKNWKIAPGQYATFNAAALIAVGDALEAHVSAAFAAEQAHATAILALTTEAAMAAYNIAANAPGAAWPANPGVP